MRAFLVVFLFITTILNHANAAPQGAMPPPTGATGGQATGTYAASAEPQLQVDPTTGLIVDPATGIYYDPNTGNPVDPASVAPAKKGSGLGTLVVGGAVVGLGAYALLRGGDSAILRQIKKKEKGQIPVAVDHAPAAAHGTPPTHPAPAANAHPPGYVNVGGRLEHITTLQHYDPRLREVPLDHIGGELHSLAMATKGSQGIHPLVSAAAGHDLHTATRLADLREFTILVNHVRVLTILSFPP